MARFDPVDPRARLAIAQWPPDAPRGAVSTFCPERRHTGRDLATVLGDLVIALASTHRFGQAVVHGERALQIWERHALTDPQDARVHILICLANLATCHEALGDHAQARATTLNAPTGSKDSNQRWPKPISRRSRERAPAAMKVAVQ